MRYFFRILITTICLVLILYVASVLIPLNNFPVPSGTFGVGCTSYHWIDTNRLELNVADQAHPNRELMVYIYYPAELKTKEPVTPYDRYAAQSALEFISHQSGIPTWLLPDFSKIKIYSQPHAQIASQTYPVIIMTQGVGTMIQHYTWILEELASNGYIVVGINHTYFADITEFPDGRKIKSLKSQKQKEPSYEAWKEEYITTGIADIRFVIDNLAKLNAQKDGLFFNKLYFEHIGICGHSRGGQLAMQVCQVDARIKACASMDGFTTDPQPFSTPCMALVAAKSHTRKEDLQKKKVFDALCRTPGTQISEIIFKNIGHGVFSDLSFLLSSRLLTRILSIMINFDLDVSAMQGCVAIGAIRRYLDQFFDKYLQGKSSELLIAPRCGLLVDA